jgi:hypothetical protein
MRKTLILLVGVAAALAVLPAHAKTISRKTATLSALPCAAVTCSYYTPHTSNPGAFFTQWGYAVDDSYKKDADAETAFACTEPLSASTYKDIVVAAPRGSKLLLINYKPTIDWDVFVCAKPKSGNNGPMLASENVPTIDSCQAGCPSYVSLKVKPGVKYVIRAYNFSDYDSLKLTYAFLG